MKNVHNFFSKAALNSTVQTVRRKMHHHSFWSFDRKTADTTVKSPGLFFIYINYPFNGKIAPTNFVSFTGCSVKVHPYLWNCDVAGRVFRILTLSSWLDVSQTSDAHHESRLQKVARSKRANDDSKQHVVARVNMTDSSFLAVPRLLSFQTECCTCDANRCKNLNKFHEKQSKNGNPVRTKNLTNVRTKKCVVAH